MMTEKKLTFEKLESYISAESEQAWIGTRPLVDAEVIDLKFASNFRVSEKFRQSYDVVWLFEENLFEEYTYSWMLVLDEVLRLFNKQGLLVIRSSDNENGTLYALKSFLSRRINISVVLLDQFLSGTETVSLFRIERKFLDIYKDKSWSFGILSNGNKNKNVINLIEKITQLSKGFDVEFLVAGPEIKELEGRDDVSFVCGDLDALARISEKKNKIVLNSKFCNVALFHDRYIVDENFFLGFEEFGYDFDYITVKQIYPSGVEFPSYLKFKENNKNWQTPIFISRYNEVCASSFLNGGLLIIKRKVAEEVNFNPLLLHNEAEDVEYAMQLFSIGIVPRINSISSAHTIDIDESYTNTFILDDCKFNSRSMRTIIKKIFKRFWVALPIKMKMKIKKMKGYEKIKSFYLNR